MGLKVQICPIGFEYKRVLAGLKAYPANTVYLLYSKIKKEEYDDREKKEKDDILERISQEFTEKLFNYLERTIHMDVKKCEISFVLYTKLIKNLCDILGEIFQLGDVDEIWINTSTGTKLFVAAGQYIASFRPDIIHLFYVRPHNYTINMLIDGKSTLDQIRQTFEDEGITYSDDGLEKAYTTEQLPVIPTLIPSQEANQILKALLAHCSADFVPTWTPFKVLIEHLEPGFRQVTDRSYKKSLKMKYHHHINKLIQRQLIQVETEGREKKYILTKQGVIFAIIASTIPLHPLK